MAEYLACVWNGEATDRECRAEELLSEITRLRAENERLRETTAAPGSNDEWMRLFGVTWYSDEYHKRAIADIQRERDEARRIAENYRNVDVGPGHYAVLPWEKA